MFLAFYNKEHVGDTLLLLAKETNHSVETQSHGQITRIYDKQTQETLAYNIFHISEHLHLDKTGFVTLSCEQVDVVNRLLQESGFMPITVDNSPKFVIGHVDSCIEHPDSDHLHITQVSIGEDKPLQIVCGAANVNQGQLVVVAKIGAVMPSGLIIWPGELRGVESCGMLCSAKELALENYPSQKGILVLEQGQVGQSFFQ
ncbi:MULTISPECIES: YtpR family tRNA-binding protein [unclassified Granulicatella]|uniref:YtpR family tRNA-binding protein n=1 Tax=unclassified Granulicatella TaxID=2630493 RepID=UPI001073092A|nr:MULTISPECIES: DUF4479 and tRNA-binding domain-containing protein [unclassified Granulicatella]MBF0779846.1 DUF4479 and tRNA-binding domain-containing protein [Granulicatella sp. 19428wC4_WM01]TFU96146.1 DUF4479 domain-containing protein [Granulicatella sp. WM01]